MMTMPPRSLPMDDSIPRDLYKHEVDFAELALQFPDFAKRLKSNGQLDFSDPETVRQLTKCLLRRDFGLEIDLPEDRLCPPVPNRYNYILWIQALLDSSNEEYSEKYDPEREVIGLDIGTGASCIYPLLGCRARSNWKFVATELDPKSSSFAKQNIETNKLDSRIKLLEVSADDPLIPESMLINVKSPIDFTMVNPPFYSSTDDLLASAAFKARPPNSACTGADVEMIYPVPPTPTVFDPSPVGGELSFILRLLHQSALPHVRHRIQWFTTMLGKLSSASELLSKIKELGCTNYSVTEFLQGSKTRRWGVAWSWSPLRPANHVARGTEALGKAILPPKTEITFPTVARDEVSHASSSHNSLNDTATSINSLITSIEGIQWDWNHNQAAGIGKAAGNVWGRKARRKRKLQALEENDRDPQSNQGSSATELSENVFVFRIFVRAHSTLSALADEDRRQVGIEIHIQWLEGYDAVVFESFCEMVRRAIQ